MGGSHIKRLDAHPKTSVEPIKGSNLGVAQAEFYP